MFKVVPCIPEGLWIIKILRAHVLESFAGKIMVICAAIENYLSTQVKEEFR